MTTDTTGFASLLAGDQVGRAGPDRGDVTSFTTFYGLRHDRQQLLRHIDMATRSIDTALGGVGEGLPVVVTVYWAGHTNFTDPGILYRAGSRTPGPEAPSTRIGRAYALETFERVRDRLGLDDGRMAALARISRNTPRDWRHGNRPKGATTRRLFELASILDVVATQESDLAAWARSLSPAGVSWLEVAGRDNGPAVVLDAYRPALFAARPPVSLEVGGEEDTLAASEAPVAGLVERRPGGRRQPR